MTRLVGAPGCAAVAVAAALAAPAWAGDDFAGASIIFARGSSLYRVDARGRGETEIAKLAAKVTVRALRCDAGGAVLLADLAGKWAWMPLDGSTRALIELPCGDGPAQLAEDGSAVLCRSTRAPSQSIVVELTGLGPAQPRVTVDVPPGTAHLVGSGAERRLVWADGGGVWTAAPGELRKKTRAAPDAPLRGFLPSPDGAHAIAVYADQIFSDIHRQRPAEVLMTVALDGQGARRKAIAGGVAVEWSHDAQWLLVQDGASACIMRASGGQYKCWRGYTAASLSGDGRWGLALGNRDGSKKQTPARPAKARSGKPGKPAPAPPTPPPAGEPASADDKPWDHLDEPSDEPESSEPAPPIDPTGEDPRPAGRAVGVPTPRDRASPIDDVSVAPPSGPLSLYRLRLEGAFTDRPALLVKVVDGAAVWVPGPP
ncbi:MAG: hypothetical protein E6J90_19910 [Deltaproteobacteria bacterium]|nr:MAG: hypothetical protein E6J91_20900 [Deltaproteobacteria bacterium]TMQ18566.1 MAG: hypothetical protein E6J90_19910 [Deltaproteobacteria bacterium]